MSTPVNWKIKKLVTINIFHNEITLILNLVLQKLNTQKRECGDSGGSLWFFGQLEIVANASSNPT